ncbi:hypothetical protein E2320_013659 [Naja naja]|nr:hypothetical protein E2320_013659 [Naja naja]
MTQAEIKLCSLLLCEHFGEIVEKVRKALCVLIQHNLVIFQQQKRGQVEYEAQCSRMLRILRYPRYIYTAKTLYSDTGELIVEELLLNGKMTMSAVVKKVADRLTETMEGEWNLVGFSIGKMLLAKATVKRFLVSLSTDGKTMDYSEVSATFTCLADTHFVQRCPSPPERSESTEARPSPTPALAINEKDMYAVPKLNLIGKGKRKHSDNTKEDGEREAKQSRQDLESEEPSADSGIFWQVNIDRFHQHFRDQAIVSAVANRMDQRWRDVRDQYPLEEGLSVSRGPVSESEGSHVADPEDEGHSCGIFSLTFFPTDLHKGLASLATATLESIVQESTGKNGFMNFSLPCSEHALLHFPPGYRFGSRCARIFRLLLRKRHLEQKQIEDFAMIPAKEAKEMMYKMLSANIVALQPDCTHGNLLRLLEKSQRVEAILASVQATGAEQAQLQEIEEMITAPERQQLETLKHNVNKIDASETQVDETIFILESYINSTIRH